MARLMLRGAPRGARRHSHRQLELIRLLDEQERNRAGRLRRTNKRASFRQPLAQRRYFDEISNQIQELRLRGEDGLAGNALSLRL